MKTLKRFLLTPLFTFIICVAGLFAFNTPNAYGGGIEIDLGSSLLMSCGQGTVSGGQGGQRPFFSVGVSEMTAQMPESNRCIPPAGQVFSHWMCEEGFTGETTNLNPGDTWTIPSDSDPEVCLCTAQYGDDNSVKFTVTTSATNEFSFGLSAQGTFLVDCGTGGTLSSDDTTANAMISGGTIAKNDTTNYTFKCSYSDSAVRTIGFGKAATDYNTSTSVAAISFNNADAPKITAISGDLSKIFPCVSSSSCPSFYYTFDGCTGLTSIPAELFSDITVTAPIGFMGTFRNCTGLTSIPATLFSGITTSGNQAFQSTFWGCTGLTSIPATLFSSIRRSGFQTFNSTFRRCSNLTGYIPPTLFDGLINNNVATNTFSNTFSDTGMDDTCPSGTIEIASQYNSGWGGKVSCVEPTFTVTTSATNEFTFDLSAAGNFVVGCGTGGTLYSDNSTANSMISGGRIAKNDTTNYTFKCVYRDSAVRTISFGGIATDYNTSGTAIQFGAYSGRANAAKITAVSGDLSAMFPYKSGNAEDGAQPRFGGTFSYATNLTSVPNTLFRGYTRASTYMFDGTFSNTGLTSIPSELFSSITTSANYMFEWTFRECTGLTSIPANLFSSFSTAADGMFLYTFYGCRSLTSIPSGLFSSFSTATDGMFAYTFTYSGLTSIPSDLFSGITNSTSNMFEGTFSGCQNLTTIPSGLFSSFRTGAEYMFRETFSNTGLTSIPSNLFSTITTSASNMFYKTFEDCQNLTTIPSGLFSSFTTGAQNMFDGTFSYTGLTSIPSELFSSITTSASGMFSSTFSGCYDLTTIPSNLFSSITTGARGMFFDTFDGAGITSIPVNLFSSITTSADYMFSWTFFGCDNLTSVPLGLFSNFTTGAEEMFSFTFGYSGITTIPSNLFSSITTGANNMFQETFESSGLTGYVPSTLFDGLIKNNAATNTFYQTFSYTGMDTSCPTGMVEYASQYTGAWGGKVSCVPGFSVLYSCSSDGETPPTDSNLYASGSVVTAASNTCVTPSGKIFGYWNCGGTNVIVGNTFTMPSDDVTCTVQYVDPDYIASYSCGTGSGTPPASVNIANGVQFVAANNVCSSPNGKMFSGWLVSGTNTIVYPSQSFIWNYSENKTLTAQYEDVKFSVTTSATNEFQFMLSAAGTFYVDCGTGGMLSSDDATANAMISGGTKITKSDVANYTFKCSYSDSAVRTIGFGGGATNYNTTTTVAALSFDITSSAAKITAISGNLSVMFPYISRNAANGAQPRFHRAFYGATNLTSIPSTLFSGYTTASTYMFNVTFSFCTGLTSFSQDLFASFTTGADGMFASTFANCTGLTSIPSTVVSNMTAGANYMFQSTFANCTGLTSIPSGLFTRFTTGGNYMFQSTFYGCTGLTSIPSGLFASFTTGAFNMFNSTFYGCTGLTSIPSNLFGNITAGVQGIFTSTFKGCTGLTSIPSGLFSSFTTGASRMFESTFQDCTSLTSIPSGLFASVATGTSQMFMNTFSGCTSLTSIPSDLFAHFTTCGSHMFYGTFNGCTNLTGYIPPTLFDGLVRSNVSANTFYQTFTGTGMLASCPARTTQYATNYTTAWGSKVSCIENYKFNVTTSATNELKFALSAQGTFLVDCGTGGTLSSDDATANAMISGGTIAKNDTTNYTFKCSYSDSAIRTIYFGGVATDYSTSTSVYGSFPNPTISFCYMDNGDYDNTNANKITAISGDLSAIFPYISANAADGAQPRFDTTFHSSNITSIPNTLFSGYITSSTYMFANTFSNCTSLTSDGLPDNLFFPNARSVDGQDYLFSGTFSGCTGLTSIPEGLFAKVTTSAFGMFSATFSVCTGLTSDGIPENLFFPNAVSVNGYGMLFGYTFRYCTGLTYIPENLFAKVTTAAGFVFDSTFENCTNLAGYIPPSTFSGLIANGSPTVEFMWQHAFFRTQLVGSCPAGTSQYITGYEGSNDGHRTWNGKVSCAESDFTITTSATNGFSFTLSAAGNFVVDCGTGGTLSGTGVSGNTITKSNTTNYTYSCSYSGSAVRTISFGGTATNYNTSDAAISFSSSASKITAISGDLSAMFPYMYENAADGAQPRFNQTFSGANITSIPNTLFSGYTRASTQMFFQTFSWCSNLTSIPSNLFANMTTGADTAFLATFNFSGLTTLPSGLFASFTTGGNGMFSSTFVGCANLTSIPSNLFANITTGVEGMFSNTFAISGLTSIPSGLFSNITTSARYMFEGTFNGCASLTTIPSDLFSGITTGASGMFRDTFYGCTSLTTIPSGLFANITTSASDMFQHTFAECTNLTTIPSNLFSGIATGGTGMFYETFWGCTSLTTLPSGLFSNIVTGAQEMFEGTFAECTSLTTIPSNLFGGLTTGAQMMFTWTFQNCTSLTAVPSGLFTNIATGAQEMFMYTFENCSSLTTIPSNLFSGMTTAEMRTFDNPFFGCTNLTGYIPPTMFAGLIANNASASVFEGVFGYTGMDESCPTGMVEYAPQYTGAWGGKVSCECASGYQLNTSTNTCERPSIVCAAGTYLPANATECTTCPTNSYCPGGTYTSMSSSVQGLNACPSGLFAPVGMSVVDQCGHILHIGDKYLYLRGTKRTVPSLNVDINNDGTPDFFASMVTVPVPMNTSFNNSANNKLTVIYNNKTHYIHDETSYYDFSKLPTDKFGTYGYSKDPNRCSYKSPEADRYVTVAQSDPNCTELNEGDWRVDFDFGRIYGKSICSTTASSNQNYIADTINETGGGSYCWCRVTTYVPSGSSIRYMPSNNVKWAADLWKDNDYTYACRNSMCALRCSILFRNTQSYRQSMFGQSTE